MRDKVPVIVKCPYCQPGPYAFVGTIISRVCKACQAKLTQEDED